MSDTRTLTLPTKCPVCETAYIDAVKELLTERPPATDEYHITCDGCNSMLCQFVTEDSPFYVTQVELDRHRIRLDVEFVDDRLWTFKRTGEDETLWSVSTDRTPNPLHVR